jgi:hypothetical protein
MAVWWAATFSGFGQMMLGSYIMGYLLVILEIILNILGNLNLTIYYSFTGNFEMAKSVANVNWLVAYTLIYVYGLWDAYVRTIATNQQSMLASLEKAPIDVFVMKSFCINFIHNRTPWFSLVWSLILPGLGHLYLLRIGTAFFLILFSLVCIYFSHLVEAVQYTLLGEFSLAIAITDPQWILFFPSIYCFAAYDAYVSTVEINKLCDTELQELMQANYQAFQLKLPIFKMEEPIEVLIAATFNYSNFVEVALLELEQNGIPKEKTLAIPLEQQAKNLAVLDTIHRSDGLSFIDTGGVTATIGMVLGVIYGFILSWGPIIWGLIGLFGGGAVGIAGDYLLTKRKLAGQKKDKGSELVLIVNCEKNQANLVEQILRKNTAFGVGKVMA